MDFSTKAIRSAPVRASRCLSGIWDFRSETSSQWSCVRVPSSYGGVRRSWGGIHWDGFDYPVEWQERAGVYRRGFQLPLDWQGWRLRFHCEACAHHYQVFVNDIAVGEHHDGYTPAEMDITEAVQPGQNWLEVHVSAQKSDLFGDYGQFRRGIWQDCWLHRVPETSIERQLFVQTSVRQQALRIDVPVLHQSRKPARLQLQAYVTELDGTLVHEVEGQTCALEPGKLHQLSLSSLWPNPRLWFPHDPHLHLAHVVLTDDQGKVVDWYRQRFGFRDLTWSGPHLYLNGRELFLRGHGGHYLGDLQGSREYMRRWLTELKRRGVNFMRLHTSPKHRPLYEVADEVGMLLEAEAVCHFVVPTEERVWKEHLRGLIQAQRNHPSVAMWSVSNELRWRGGGERPEMLEFVKSLDDTRPVFASDFSLESRHGDLVAHHYDPMSVFQDWQEYGLNKPMIWDELGSVWQQDRPLDNGTSGYEVQAQDYATGLWHDGHNQILRDVSFMHDGREINGELYRVNAFVPWDLSYVFFRWQPVNNNQLLRLGGVAEQPGIQLRHVRPCSSTVNAWDPSLPALEPNPGYYLFAQYMQPVRFFDSFSERSFWAGEVVDVQSRVFYDDTRFADQLECRVELPTGELLTREKFDIDLKPGQIQAALQHAFRMPEVDSPTEVRLVRQFSHEGRIGYRDEIAAKVFPASERIAEELEGVCVALLPNCEKHQGELERLGIRALPLKEAGEQASLVLAADQQELDSCRRRPALCLRGAGYYSDRELSTRYVDDFVGHGGQLSPETRVHSPGGCRWSGYAHNGGIRIAEQHHGLQSENGRLEFGADSRSSTHAEGLLDRPLYDLRAGRVHMRYHSDAPLSHEALREDPNAFDRSVRLLLRTRAGTWYQSDAVMLEGIHGAVQIALADRSWWQISGSLDVPLEPPEGSPEQPDLLEVTGVGLSLAETSATEAVFWISKMEWLGAPTASPMIPLHGPHHRLLAGIDQRDLSAWRGGGAQAIVELSAASSNERVILAGNHDGAGACLLERMSSEGLTLTTSLSLLEDASQEPAAAWLFRNALHYLAHHQTRAARPALADVGATWEQALSRVQLARSPLRSDIRMDELAQSPAVLLDASEPEFVKRALGHKATLTDYVEAGGSVMVLSANSSTLPALRELSGLELALTEPYLHERCHCIKAPVSWTKVDTPPTPVQYYEGVLIPQPFERNYDPLLAGFSNSDLHWDGEPLFDEGIELVGMDPVRACHDYSIVISNWRIDWSKPDFGGEYIHAGKDLRQADWFINRDPVVLRVRQGRGSWVFCQLELTRQDPRAQRLLARLLTNLGCALGEADEVLDPDWVFDLSQQEEQYARFRRHYEFLQPVRRQHYGSPPQQKIEHDPEERHIQTALIGDQSAVMLSPYLMQELWETHKVNAARSSAGTTRDALQHFKARHSWRNLKVVILSYGLEDLKRDATGIPTVPVDEFAENLQSLINVLKKHDVQIHWVTIIPLPQGVSEFVTGDEDIYNAAAQRVMDANGVYTNDVNRVLREQFPKIGERQSIELDAEQKMHLGSQVAQAIRFFGAQQ